MIQGFNGGAIQLSGATINGGALATDDIGSAIETTAGTTSVLNGVTLSADTFSSVLGFQTGVSSQVNVVGSSTLTLKGAITNSNGTIALQSTGELGIGADVTLTSPTGTSGVITLSLGSTIAAVGATKAAPFFPRWCRSSARCSNFMAAVSLRNGGGTGAAGDRVVKRAGVTGRPWPMFLAFPGRRRSEAVVASGVLGAAMSNPGIHGVNWWIFGGGAPPRGALQ
jgi:hypothetical protein